MKSFSIGSANRLVFAFVPALVLAACANVPTVPAKTSSGVLTDQSGMTLYTFDRDAAGSGKSVCNGPCAANWPAFAAPAASTAPADWSIVTRDDSSRQWAYQGKPLYTFAKDAKAGDKTGDGFNGGTWHVARP